MQGNYFNNAYSNLEQYVVKKNDSLYMIAKKYNVTVDDLKNVNHLVSNMIYPNQVLFIPKKNCFTVDDGNMTYQGINIIDNFKGKYRFNHDMPYNKVYVVKPNDSIEDILAKFNLSPLDFLKLNEKEILEPGEEIIIAK